MNEALGADIVQIALSVLGWLWWLSAAVAIGVIRRTDVRLCAEDGDLSGPRGVMQRQLNVTKKVRPWLHNRIWWSWTSLSFTGMGLVILGAGVVLGGVDGPYRNVYGEFSVLAGLVTIVPTVQAGAGLAFFRMEFDAAALQREMYEEYRNWKWRRWFDSEGMASFWMAVLWGALSIAWVALGIRVCYAISS
ncbi:MAG: hypothetical protein OXD31_15310 [Chloroflexi bacterium]|nr:hypothetical protein [Chloroflexota bacterium]